MTRELTRTFPPQMVTADTFRFAFPRDHQRTWFAFIMSTTNCALLESANEDKFSEEATVKHIIVQTYYHGINDIASYLYAFHEVGKQERVLPSAFCAPSRPPGRMKEGTHVLYWGVAGLTELERDRESSRDGSERRSFTHHRIQLSPCGSHCAGDDFFYSGTRWAPLSNTEGMAEVMEGECYRAG